MPDRREFLTGLAAAGAASLVTRGSFFAQAPGRPYRLDVHHHFASPWWQRRNVETKRQGWETVRDYSPAKAIEMMDRAGIQTGFCSLTTPGLWFGDDFNIEREEAIRGARDMNDFAAKMMSDYKGRFGLFTVLPMPDIDATLKEIAYGLDTLKADGVGFVSSYGRQWLGDKAFDPIWQELNRRNAVVYTHPTDSACCHNIETWSGPGTIEWLTDTARSIHSIIAEGPNRAPSVATRYPNIKFIWSHAGGALLGLVSRVVGGVSGEELAATPPMNSHLYHVRRFYYDTAGSANPVLMGGLKRLLGDTSHILFGTDLPFAGGGMTVVKELPSSGLTAAELRGVERENALKILPKWRT
jgi:6-methylsalicylate decarboxylase